MTAETFTPDRGAVRRRQVLAAERRRRREAEAAERRSAELAALAAEAAAAERLPALRAGVEHELAGLRRQTRMVTALDRMLRLYVAELNRLGGPELAARDPFAWQLARSRTAAGSPDVSSDDRLTALAALDRELGIGRRP